MDEGQDLNDIDFNELNKIGEDWENAGRVDPAGIAGNVGEPGPEEDAGVASWPHNTFTTHLVLLFSYRSSL